MYIFYLLFWKQKYNPPFVEVRILWILKNTPSKKINRNKTKTVLSTKKLQQILKCVKEVYSLQKWKPSVMKKIRQNVNARRENSKYVMLNDDLIHAHL